MGQDKGTDCFGVTCRHEGGRAPGIRAAPCSDWQQAVLKLHSEWPATAVLKNQVFIERLVLTEKSNSRWFQREFLGCTVSTTCSFYYHPLKCTPMTYTPMYRVFPDTRYKNKEESHTIISFRGVPLRNSLRSTSSVISVQSHLLWGSISRLDEGRMKARRLQEGK